MPGKTRVLTGITPSGTPHLGNYLGAMKPAIDSQYLEHTEQLFFIADYHSLIKLNNAKLRQQYTYEIAAAWLALGLDPNQTLFYRQSDIPEILELNWILTSVASKGLLNRAHAYKDGVSKNIENNEDPDFGITMGLFNYPVLMSADIIAFNAHEVPVGKDQIQHIEIARDLAQRINHIYQKNICVLPKAITHQNAQILQGLDGRKMSKSYDNTIPLFLPAKKLRKCIMKIKTNSQLPEEPKDPENCTVFNIFQSIASQDQIESLKNQYLKGIGWGDAKQVLFECLDKHLEQPREKYNDLIADTAQIDHILKQGAEKAREISRPILDQIKQTIGISKL